MDELRAGCFAGNIGMVNSAIVNGACDWNSGLSATCCGNQSIFTQLSIGIPCDTVCIACCGPHREIAQMMIDLGATSCSNCHCPPREHVVYKN